MKVNNLRLKYLIFLHSSLNGLSKGQKMLFVLCNIFLSIYITFIFYIAYSSIFINPALTFQVICKSIFLTIIVFHLILLLCTKLKSLEIEVNATPAKLNKKTWLSYSVFCLLVLLIGFVTHFPGLISYDCYVQWTQVQQCQFDNWHPVIHTWTIWLFTRLCNHYGFVIFCQILLFSYAVGYLIATLETWRYPKKLLLFLGLFIVLNPFTQGIVLYMWKDVFFTVLLIFIAAHLFNIYLSGGKFLTQWRNIIAFSICVGFATLVRHNGMFFTFPLLALLFFFYLKNNWKVSLILVIAGMLIVLIRGPLYTALKVTYPDNTYSESVGLPMTILGDALVKNPQTLLPEAKDLLNSIAADDIWHEQYIPGNYNSIKERFWETTRVVYYDIPPKELAAMTLHTIKANPRNAFLAVTKPTASVWEVVGDFHAVHLFSNPESIRNEANSTRKLFKGALFIFKNFMVSIPLLGELFTKTGLHILLLLLAGMVSIYKNQYKALLFILPSVMYNWGTMLLLCTDKDIRFFHFNVVITIPVILVLFSKSWHK